MKNQFTKNKLKKLYTCKKPFKVGKSYPITCPHTLLEFKIPECQLLETGFVPEKTRLPELTLLHIFSISIKLGKLSLDSLQALADKIIRLHCCVYGWKLKISSEAIKNWTLLTLGNPRGSVSLPNTRKFVVKLVEILDIMEQNPSCSIFGSELKIVTRNGISTFVNTITKAEAEG